ncbi:Transcriptional regulator, LacI family [Serinibacter arcticus]|uniref:Transcriptional regulator, LacI family n=1 Tax=Serinibacter arcticus TaxID=1655435 RepID=A0A4Z1E1F2_9MICO|nr:Transcriptional regulator, LacI family [Serinibacter arcticus]
MPAMIAAGYDPSSGYEAGRALTLLDDVTAVLCGNDEIAIGVTRALREGGRRVPEDVSVVGFDDQPFAEMWLPPLTTVAQDFTELGRRSIALLTSWLDSGVKPVDWVGQPSLVVRESTASPL